jgi:energy-coupling factor transporter transmembrane protein EcfT
MFQLSIPSLIGRYYLMMLVCIIAVVTHSSWLIALTFAIAVSAILGYRIPWRRDKESGKVIPMEGAPKRESRKAG